MKKAFAVQAACAALAAVAGLAIAAGEGPLAEARQRPPQIRVQTTLVNIVASVSDASGEPIAGLPQEAFALTEEGVPQKIARFEPETNRPLDLVLMVDSSASALVELKLELEAAAQFIGRVLRPGDTLAVFEFSDDVTELADFSGDVPRLQAAVRHVSPGSGTSMYDALVLGSSALRRRPADRRRAIVLVTDAGETTSKSQFEDARRGAVVSEALVYSVIVRPVKNENGRNTAGEHALITIEESAGGGAFILDDVSQIGAIFDRINRELRTQYLLGYYPNPTPPPGSLRHVGLQVTGGYAVHYRSEYFTARAPR